MLAGGGAVAEEDPARRTGLPGEHLGQGGDALAACEPARELLNPAFAVKMVLVVAAVISALLLGRTLRRAAGSVAGLKLAGLVFLGLWVTIAVLGRLIAYVDTGA